MSRLFARRIPLTASPAMKSALSHARSLAWNAIGAPFCFSFVIAQAIASGGKSTTGIMYAIGVVGLFCIGSGYFYLRYLDRSLGDVGYELGRSSVVAGLIAAVCYGAMAGPSVLWLRLNDWFDFLDWNGAIVGGVVGSLGAALLLVVAAEPIARWWMRRISETPSAQV